MQNLGATLLYYVHERESLGTQECVRHGSSGPECMLKLGERDS